MERLTPPIVDEINGRITRFGTAKIICIEGSGICLHEKFLENWNTLRVSNTESVLSNSEQNRIFEQVKVAYSECAEKCKAGKISLDSANLIESLLKCDERRILGSRIGLCYDWGFVLDFAKRGEDEQVKKICTRDLFLIKAIGYWCAANVAYNANTGYSFIPESYVPKMEAIYRGWKQVKNTDNLEFPVTAKAPDFIGLGKESIVLIERDLNRIQEKVDSAKYSVKPASF